MEIITVCPVCNQTGLRFYRRINDYFLTNEEFSLEKCDHCETIITNPRPNIKEIGKYYQSDNYISHSDKSSSIIDVLYKMVRNVTLQQKYKLVNSLNTEHDILDIGCGTGYFLSYMLHKNWTVTGFEPNKTSRNIAINQNKVHVLENLSSINHKFSIITLWHVLEHIHNLDEIKDFLQSHIKDNGYIIIAVPNYQSYDADKYEQYWAAWDVPRHLYHFTKKSINTFSSSIGFKIAKIIPMKFDSFYVSMLSEKYLIPKGNILSAFFTGLKSNLKAKNENNYSSLIYVLHK